MTAAISLLQHSKLVKWDRTGGGKFVEVDYDAFGKEWGDIDSTFGRFICWMTFSAGAELLAKGVCLINGARVDRYYPKPEPPSSRSDAQLVVWAKQFNLNKNCNGIRDTLDLGTLKSIIGHPKKEVEKRHPNSHEDDEEKLIAAYQLLNETIRNRDAHVYVKDVRDDHFHLVKELFAPCFNLMPRRRNLWVAASVSEPSL